MDHLIDILARSVGGLKYLVFLFFGIKFMMNRNTKKKNKVLEKLHEKRSNRDDTQHDAIDRL